MLLLLLLPFFNDDDGPIVIEDDVTIMEGAMIRGPVHICKGSIIKMGAKIYGPTVIGPYCKIGGEVSNCIFLGYSNICVSHSFFLQCTERNCLISQGHL